MEPTIITNPEDPRTLREVGIHLGNLAKSLEDIKVTEKQHHSDNIARNDIILEKLDGLKNSYIERTEFLEHLKADEDHENRIRTLEESRWKVVTITGAITGFLSIIGSYLVSLLK